MSYLDPISRRPLSSNSTGKCQNIHFCFSRRSLEVSCLTGGSGGRPDPMKRIHHPDPFVARLSHNGSAFFVNHEHMRFPFLADHSRMLDSWGRMAGHKMLYGLSPRLRGTAMSKTGSRQARVRFGGTRRVALDLRRTKPCRIRIFTHTDCSIRYSGSTCWAKKGAGLSNGLLCGW